MSRNNLRGRLLCGAVLVSYATVTHAFESAEHCKVSNLALDIAISYVQRTERNFDAELLDRVLHHFLPTSNSCQTSNWTRPGEEPFSYGKITALVDFTPDPIDLFSSYGSTQAEPEPVELSQTYFSPRLNLFERYTAASHNNGAHFQALLLASYKHWHNSAMETARTNLFLAVAQQAVASHYEQDMAAPGHIATPRDGFPDVVALSWHDRFNRIGMPVVINGWALLVPLRDYLLNSDAADAERFERQFQSFRRSSTGSDDPPSTSLLIALDQLAASRESHCPSDLRALYRSSLELLRDSEANELTWPVVCFHGDGHLRSSPKQLAALVLIEARNILDVLLQSLDPSRKAPATEYVWCPRMIDIVMNRQHTTEAPRDDATCAGALEKAKRLLSTSRRTKAAPHLETRLMSYSLAPSHDSTGFASFDPVFAISLASRSDSNSRRGLKATWAVEALPIGLVGAPDFARDANFESIAKLNVGLVLGYEAAFTKGNGFHDAVTGRLLFAFPRIDVQASAVFDYAYSSGEGARNRGLGYGVRVDLGFSLLSTFLEVGSFPSFAGQRQRQELYTRGGLALQFTGNRVAALLGR